MAKASSKETKPRQSQHRPGSEKTMHPKPYLNLYILQVEDWPTKNYLLPVVIAALAKRWPSCLQKKALMLPSFT
jgi:hypothetical protein